MGLAYDQKNQITTAFGFLPQALSGTTNIVGEIVDTLGYESLTFVITTDAIAAAALSAVLLIEEGNASNVSDAAAVADADLVGTEADTLLGPATTSIAVTLGYTGSKRYVRPTLVVTTNNGTDVVGLISILGHQKQI